MNGVEGAALVGPGQSPRSAWGPAEGHSGAAGPDLLFLTQRIPYPPDKGEKIRHLPILRHLCESYRVHLGCLVDDPADIQHIPVVRGMVADAYFGVLDRRMAKITCLRGLLTGEPLSVTFFRDRGLQAWVTRKLAEVRPAVVFVCSSNMAAYVLDSGYPAPVFVVDFCDVDSEKWREYAQTNGGPMRWVHRREWRLTAAMERRIAAAADWSTFVSRQEAALFERLVPEAAARVRTVSNGVDCGYFDPALGFAAPFDLGRPNFVFTGTMDYPPNVDAVTWFCREVLPLIRAVRPDAQFHIAGANPSPAVQALAGDGVFVTGRVADMRPYIAHATASVAPMRIARGIQNKVLEAMAMGRPVVATAAGLEGIDAVAGREVILADGAAAFGTACLGCLDGAGDHIGAAARAKVVGSYSWAERMRGFDPLLVRGL